VLAHSVRRCDLVEIEPALVKAVRGSPLHEVSRRALDRKEVRLLVADARAVYAARARPLRRDHLRALEPVESRASATSFTQEAFTLARRAPRSGRRLLPVDPRGLRLRGDVRLVARTFVVRLPARGLFEVAPNTDYLLVAVKDGEVGHASEERFTKDVKDDLELLELGSVSDRGLLPPGRSARRRSATSRRAGPLNTDDSALLELLAPLAVSAHLDLLRMPAFASRRERGLAARDTALAALAAAHERDLPREECARVLDLVERAMSEPGHASGAAAPPPRRASAPRRGARAARDRPATRGPSSTGARGSSRSSGATLRLSAAATRTPSGGSASTSATSRASPTTCPT